ncbi:MAG: SDR family oxidoreductase [Candidatus Sedimenticola sp. PURPLELP]
MTKTALVTGANRGLGLETSRQLAQQGFRVLLSARNEETGSQAAQALADDGLDVTYLPLDVSSDASILSAAATLSAQGTGIDVLINNAGVLLDPHTGWGDPGASILNVDRETMRETMEVNVYGPIRLVQSLLPLMNKEARIINISSGMGQLSEMGGLFPAYRISKTALNAVTKILTEELKPKNISINSVCPGWVRTDMGGPDASLSIAEGVETTVWLATIAHSPNGGFYRNKQALEW